MGLEKRSSPNATYLEIDTCLCSYPVILGVKMWSCILPAGGIGVELEIDLIHLCG